MTERYPLQQSATVHVLDGDELPPLTPANRAIPVPADALRHIAQVAPEAGGQLLDALRVLELHGGWPGLWAASCVSALDAALPRHLG
jgi:hypothetical protein